MSTTKKISILIIMVGLLLPVASLGFVEGYNPNLGFVGSLPQMRVVFVERGERSRGELYFRVTVEEQAISYGYVCAFGCILVCLGTAGILFDPKPIMSVKSVANNVARGFSGGIAWRLGFAPSPKRDERAEGEQAKNEVSPPETPVDLPVE